MKVVHVPDGSPVARSSHFRLTDQAEPFTARRTETLEALGLSAQARLADHVAVHTPNSGPRIAADGFVTSEEATRLAELRPTPPLLAQVLERPASQPLELSKAERVIRREVWSTYDPSWVELKDLPAGFRPLALRILEALDAKFSAETNSEEYPHSLEGMISEAIIAKYKALDDLELVAYDPAQPKVTAADRRAMADTLLRHITAETNVSETEPQHPRPAVTRFPVAGAKIDLVTTPVPDYEAVGRLSYHNLNRVVEVKPLPGHTVVINVQSVKKGEVSLAEHVLKHKADGTSHELPYLPGISSGEPAEVWITVLKDKEVVANVNYAVPKNPIVKRIDTVRVQA